MGAKYDQSGPKWDYIKASILATSRGPYHEVKRRFDYGNNMGIHRNNVDANWAPINALHMLPV